MCNAGCGVRTLRIKDVVGGFTGASSVAGTWRKQAVPGSPQSMADAVDALCVYTSLLPSVWLWQGASGKLLAGAAGPGRPGKFPGEPTLLSESPWGRRLRLSAPWRADGASLGQGRRRLGNNRV